MTAYDDHDLDDRAEGAPGVGILDEVDEWWNGPHYVFAVITKVPGPGEFGNAAMPFDEIMRRTVGDQVEDDG